ncbi:hypothetical protein AAMO2058_001090500 [Amorphochlora amoebiformis]
MSASKDFVTSSESAESNTPITLARRPKRGPGCSIIFPGNLHHYTKINSAIPYDCLKLQLSNLETTGQYPYTITRRGDARYLSFSAGPQKLQNSNESLPMSSSSSNPFGTQTNPFDATTDFKPTFGTKADTLDATFKNLTLSTSDAKSKTFIGFGSGTRLSGPFSASGPFGSLSTFESEGKNQFTEGLKTLESNARTTPKPKSESPQNPFGASAGSEQDFNAFGMFSSGSKPSSLYSSDDGNTVTTNKVSKDAQLLAAAKSGNVEQISILSKLCKSIDVRDNSGNTPLILAARHGHVPALKRLITLKAYICSREANRGYTSIHWAAAQDDPKALRCLILEGKGDAGTRDYEGCSPLAVAAKKGSHKAIQFLVHECKVDVNYRHSKGRSALIEAVAVNDSETVKLLLELKAQLRWSMPVFVAGKVKKEKKDQTLRRRRQLGYYDNNPVIELEDDALCVAMRSKSVEIFKLLVERTKFRPGPSELMQAIRHGNCSIVRYLVREIKVDVNSTVANNTVLCRAIHGKPVRDVQLEIRGGYSEVRGEQLDIIRELVEAKADPSKRGSNLPAYILAATKGSVSSLRLLDTVDQSHWTAISQIGILKRYTRAFHPAEKMGIRDAALRHVILEQTIQGEANLSSLKYLIEEAKAEIRGDTLTSAVESGFLESVQCLVDHQADVNRPDSTGGLPLGIASKYGHDNIAKYLVDTAKASVDRTVSGIPVLFFVFNHYYRGGTGKNGENSLLKYLIEKGKPDIKQRDLGEQTLLIAAARNACDFEGVRSLVEARSDLEAVDVMRCTALLAALSRIRPGRQAVRRAIVLYLLREGASVLVKGVDGKNVLQRARTVSDCGLEIEEHIVEKEREELKRIFNRYILTLLYRYIYIFINIYLYR